MEIFREVSKLRAFIDALKQKGGTVGFVPTMGYLHEGHLSLLGASQSDCDYSVVSIFVNPSQFNQQEDFEKYPRNEVGDLKMLEKAGCDVVFIPTVQEMNAVAYPRKLDLGVLGDLMEGVNRPGHFDGVAEIVYKLFDCVCPHKAYFGEKDFQQLLVIKKLVRDFNLGIDIIGCPIKRADSGLALSSRNARLSEVELKTSPIIFEKLQQIGQEKMTVDQAKSDLEELGISTEYIEVFKAHPVFGSRIFFAGTLGAVRLIDNISLN